MTAAGRRPGPNDNEEPGVVNFENHVERYDYRNGNLVEELQEPPPPAPPQPEPEPEGPYDPDDPTVNGLGNINVM